MSRYIAFVLSAGRGIPMNITIKDIARETGLSTATISKYLNHKKILEENRVLIEETIRRLDYRPNRSAQILRTKKTHTIAILLTDLGTYFWTSLINSVTHYFIQHNYTVITCSYSFNPGKEIKVIQDLISQNPDGVIMLPHNNADDYYQLIQEAGIPVVILDSIPSNFSEHPADCITSDNYGGGAFLARHLLENGHTNIAIVERSINSYTLEERIRGFMDVYKEKGYDTSSFLTPYPAIPFNDSQTVTERGKQRFRQVMSSPHPPTAIFFTNYTVGIGGLSAAYALTKPVPESVSLVCFDDDPLFKVMNPSLTCVSQNLKEIGEKASEILLRRIHGDYSDFPSRTIVDVIFHKRNSVKDLTRENS